MSEIAKCPCCGSAMEETYLGYVCSNTDLEDPCSFRIAKRLLPRISAAMELARAVVKANEPYCISESPIKPDYNQAVFGRYVTSEINNAEQRVLEVFK